jgi:hypothetical protein
MKDFIRDDGKVRNCTSNIAKMNIFEWMWYRNDMIVKNLQESIILLCEGIKFIIVGIINLLLVICLPITYPIGAYLNIRDAKKELEILSRYKEKI